MTAYVALVRAANVGGTGKLLMADLRAYCIDAGFADVRTYLTSGNALFTSILGERRVQQQLEARLARHAGKPVGVAIRTASEMNAVLAANPFRDSPPKSTVTIFLNAAPASDTVASATGLTTELLALGHREIYVAYGDRMADSKLRFPGLQDGTARNMNTVAKLAALTKDFAG